MKKTRNNGFSLLEAIIVIGVLAIITGMTMPLLTRATISEKIILAQSRLAAIQEALNDYFYDHAEYPNDGIRDTGFHGPYLFKGINMGDTYAEDIYDPFAPGSLFRESVNGTAPSNTQVWSVGPDGVDDTTPGSAFSNDDFGIFSYSEIPGRRRTRIKMEIIGAALAKYNYDSGGTHNMVGTWSTEYDNLLLMTEFLNDGWGTEFLDTASTAKPSLYSFGPNKADNSGGSDDVTF